jgi:hypothetical protein
MKLNNEISCSWFKWGGKGSRGWDGGSNLTCVQYKPICNCHNEYILIKKF